MLRLYQSNRLELLAQRLAEHLAEPAGSPLQAETLVVQHPAMARWLALQIAGFNGISANIRYPLPATFIWEMFGAFLPLTPELNRFSPEVLAWRILQQFDQIQESPLFKPLCDYLLADDEVRGYKLAQRLAGLFDRYLVYRPDWILKWESGIEALPGDDWQAELWRRLAATAEPHWVSLQQRLFAYRGERPSGLPQRVFLIGLPTLSPGYLQIIQWLSQWCEIHLFLLNPCAAYWTEIVDRKEQARRELETNGQELYLEVGNPLLASLGRQGRDFFAAVLEFDPGSDETFADPGELTLLHRLQRQILLLEFPESSPFEPDDSINFHVCHSPMREVEVLYDQLLGILQAQPALTPADILVMTPDMQTYAPLIEAVFTTPGDRPALPYQISDISLARDNRHVSAFLELLQLPGSRYTSNQLLALLEIPAIGRRFGIDDEALAQLIAWLAAAAIRWGRDGVSKSELGLPEDSRNTWQAGLERLLLGFAMPGDSDRLWQGIAPLDAAEGANSLWLAGLLEFCEAVFGLESELGGAHPVSDWCERLSGLTERFFAADTSAEQPLQQVRDAIAQLRENAEAAAFDRPVSLPLVRHELEQRFGRASGRGFLGGGVNFCALVPMRSLPFPIICLIGMHDGSFPREQTHLSFDLMDRQFRFGDRSRRADDRYLFLETLISARQRLYLSYVGNSIKDNSPLPPSVLLDELRDYLAALIGGEGLARITHQHPLQPFSAAYFSPDSGLFSYSTRLREAALQAGLGREVERPLLDGPLPEWSIAAEPVELQWLIEFFTNPARVFAQQRLNLQLEQGAALLEEREPFTLEGFSGAELETELVQARLAGISAQDCFARLDARGVLPAGSPGRCLFDSLMASSEALLERLLDLRLGERLPVRDFALSCGQSMLQGRLTDLYPQGQFAFSVGALYPYQLLGLWLRHLVLCLTRPRDVIPRTFWLEAGEIGAFRSVENPEQILQPLLALYRQGLDMPLPFYPGTSWAYAESLLRTGDPALAYRNAQLKWSGNERYGGDRSKPYQQLLFADGDIL
ncbi:MAG: exodeoxyribonuclease V subunit gamma, partial [Chromatiales bacterium]